MAETGDRLYTVNTDADIPAGQKAMGRTIYWLATGVLGAVAALQAADQAGMVAIGFADWKPTLYAVLL